MLQINMYHGNERDRAASLLRELLATKPSFVETKIQDGFGRAQRLSLDSKVEEISHQELLSLVDDNRLIQEIKARLISSVIKENRRKLKRSGSVQDLIRAFDNVQHEGPLNNGDRNTFRLLLGQFTFDDLCEELQKRKKVEKYENQDIQGIMFSYWSRSQRTLFSMIVIPEKIPSQCEEWQNSSLENVETHKEGEMAVHQ